MVLPFQRFPSQGRRLKESSFAVPISGFLAYVLPPSGISGSVFLTLFPARVAALA